MAHDSDSHYGFYAPWPLFGKRFSAQLGEIRQDTEALHPIVRYSATYDKDPDGPKESRLRGWEYGDRTKHNRFRTISDTDNQWKLQANTGTEQEPFWQTALAMGEDLSITNFYIPSSIRVTTTNNTPDIQSDTLIFDRTNFYITSDSHGYPIVNLLSSASSGTGSPLATDDAVNEYLNITRLSFSDAGFYLSRGSSGQPVVNSLNTSSTGISSVTFTDGVKLFTDDSLHFNRDSFYLTPAKSSGNPIVNFKGATGATGPPGPPGSSAAIVFTDGVKLFTDDNIHFNRSSFYLTPDSSGNPVLNFKEAIISNPKIQKGATWVGSPVSATAAGLIHAYVPEAMTITGVQILTEGGPGNCFVDIWVDSYNNFPPTVADKIVASDPPTITSGIKYSSQALVGWSKAVPANSVITFNLFSSDTFTLVTCTLTLEKT